MADVTDPDTRSRMMSGIRASDTAPEMMVRRFLHGLGYRYVLHDRRLPGRPDIVLPRHGVVVQVQGCFWHAHENCAYFRLPQTRRPFWEQKLLGNRARDHRNELELITAGWRVASVWECALRNRHRHQLECLDRWIRLGRQQHLVLRDESLEVIR